MLILRKFKIILKLLNNLSIMFDNLLVKSVKFNDE